MRNRAQKNLQGRLLVSTVLTNLSVYFDSLTNFLFNNSINNS